MLFRALGYSAGFLRRLAALVDCELSLAGDSELL